MNFLEIMLGEKLRDEDSALEIRGSDRKVLQVACQDFTNFLKYHWDLIGREASECDLVEKLEKLYKENPDELEEFLEKEKVDIRNAQSRSARQGHAGILDYLHPYPP